MASLSYNISWEVSYRTQLTVGACKMWKEPFYKIACAEIAENIKKFKLIFKTEKPHLKEESRSQRVIQAL